jgi:hypothetical protein
VRDHRVVEHERADRPPVLKRAPFPRRRSALLAFVRHPDVERQRALRERIAAIEDLRHDLVAEIEIGALDPWLIARDAKPQELRGPRRLLR